MKAAFPLALGIAMVATIEGKLTISRSTVKEEPAAEVAAPGGVPYVRPDGGVFPEGFKIACPAEEFSRYITIVCSPALQGCHTDWCEAHKHNWVKEFGSCSTYG